MGAPKAGLDWHGSTLLRRTVGLVARGVDGPVVVLRSPGQPLPALPPGVEVVDDPVEGRGPLQGLAVGLAPDGRVVQPPTADFLLPVRALAILYRAKLGLNAARPGLWQRTCVLRNMHSYQHFRGEIGRIAGYTSELLISQDQPARKKGSERLF